MTQSVRRIDEMAAQQMALQRAMRVERAEQALRDIRALFTVDKWWVGNRAAHVVRLIDTALGELEEGG